jgi:hypothetical protein
MEPVIKPMTPEEIAEACETAAEVLEGNWIRSRWFDKVDGEVKMCVEGALIAALWGMPDLQQTNSTLVHLLPRCPVYNAVLDTINDGVQPCPHSRFEDCECDRFFGELNLWNDMLAREEQEVLDVLHRTAKRVLGVEE